jgi:Skp family chaperone for outer membrane proteins
MDYAGVGTLFVSIATLVVATLAWRSAQRAVGLAERREEYLIDEQERMEFMREEHKSLQEELERKREESQSLHETLTRERQERLQAQQSAELAHQQALREATQHLRERMDNYLQELEESGRPGIRRVK